MKTRWFTVLALGTAVLIGTPSLMADKDKEKHHGNPHANKYRGDDDHGWERRDGYEYRTYEDHSQLPPGWNRGKKAWWKACGMPPGQAKKYGCRSYVYQGRPYYYYEGEHGQIIVRRPIVEIHGSVDIVR